MNIINGFDKLGSRVTLLVDMSPSDRCYINCYYKKEMSEIQRLTNTQINVPIRPPDLLDMPISITGNVEKTKDAYNQLSQFLPVSVFFELKCNNCSDLKLVTSEGPLKNIQEKYKLVIKILPCEHNDELINRNVTVVKIAIRAMKDNNSCQNIRHGLEELIRYIETNDIGDPSPFIQTEADVNLSQPEIQRRESTFLDSLQRQTSTQIQARRDHISMAIVISGYNFESIYNARTEVIGRTNMELHFEVTVNESQCLEPIKMEELAVKFGVHIMIKPSVHPFCKTMIVRGYEKDIFAMFEARRCILSLIRIGSDAMVF